MDYILVKDSFSLLNLKNIKIIPPFCHPHSSNWFRQEYIINVIEWKLVFCKQDICSLRIYPNRLLQREKYDKEEMFIIVGRPRWSMYKNSLKYSCNFSVSVKVLKN